MPGRWDGRLPVQADQPERLSQWINAVKPACCPAIFSVQSLLALTGGDPSSNRRLLAELLSSSRSDRQELLDVARGANRQALSEIAHKIKGVARIVQANSLIQRCEALEHACHRAQAPGRISDCIDALDRAMSELERALETEIAKAK